ncbi:MAG: tRNA (adenosine(37)-N6)-dimethylallyltransferase MiaA [Micavibrio sp.]|nr:tRNA (adenosine(37)-N6)-dimethylallyltransferase MiaA [Micavibrio sp.]
MASNLKHIIYIVCGPTASGKSARAMELARELDGVIVNCDSMQIYDALPILGAQPPEEDKAEILHLLYAHLHPNNVCSAGNYREIAEPIIQDVLDKGGVPIVCGGTGLYIKALTDGLSPMPDIPEDVRASVVAHYEDIGAEAFHAELEKRDPVIAARFHVNHKARIIRAMEVLEATGKSLAEWQKLPRQGAPEGWQFEVIKVLPTREDLYARCDARLDIMMKMGALEEAESFSALIDNQAVKENVPAAKALGFRQLREYIKGHISLEDALERAKAETRHYAKRQNTWFTNQIYSRLG